MHCRPAHVASVIVLLLAESPLQTAGAAPLILKPPAYAERVDLYGTPVGSHGWLTLQAPPDVTAYKHAILFLHVDDIDAPEETELLLNGEYRIRWPDAILGEGEHTGAIALPPGKLRAGTNDLRFTFRSNLGGATAGFAILSIELHLFAELSAAQKAKLLQSGRTSRSFTGKPVDLTRTRLQEEPEPHTPEPDAPDLTDRFQDLPLVRWPATGGEWHVTRDIDIYDLRQRDIYRSPEEPSHLRWVTIKKGRNDVLRVSFAQLTGNLGLTPSYRPCHWRNEKQWLQLHKEHNLWIGPADAIPTTTVENPVLLSADGGQTWADAETSDVAFVERDAAPGGTGSCYRELHCRDGRVLLNPRWFEYRHRAADLGLETEKEAYQRYLFGIKESLDNGKTWSDVQWVAPEGSDPQLLRETAEETAMLELDDGRILMIIRCDPGRPCQTYVTRDADGTYHATPPVRLPMAHSGIPEITRAGDGVIWYWGLDGHWYTEDDGKTWQKMPFYLRQYYGRMTEAAPNTMLCVTQHLIHDTPYPTWYDSSIRMFRFSWQRTGILQQTNVDARRVLSARKDLEFGNVHARADVRVTGSRGWRAASSPVWTRTMFWQLCCRRPLHSRAISRPGSRPKHWRPTTAATT